MFYKLLKDLTLAFPTVWGVRRNAAGKRGIPPKRKLLACLRVLGTARSFDDMDDGYRMAPDTLRKYFKLFCRHVKIIYGESFLNRLPTVAELDKMSNFYGGVLVLVNGYSEGESIDIILGR